MYPGQSHWALPQSLSLVEHGQTTSSITAINTIMFSFCSMLEIQLSIRTKTTCTRDKVTFSVYLIYFDGPRPLKHQMKCGIYTDGVSISVQNDDCGLCAFSLTSC